MAKELDAGALLDSLDEADLEAKVAAIDAEIAKVVGELERKRDSLTTLLKAVKIRKHGKPPRKKPERRAKADGERPAPSAVPDPSNYSPELKTAVELLRREIEKYGPMGASKLRSKTGLPQELLDQALQDRTFQLGFGQRWRTRGT